MPITLTIDSTNADLVAWMGERRHLVCRDSWAWVHETGYNVREAWAKCENPMFMLFAAGQAGAATERRLDTYLKIMDKWAERAACEGWALRRYVADAHGFAAWRGDCLSLKARNIAFALSEMAQGIAQCVEYDADEEEEDDPFDTQGEALKDLADQVRFAIPNPFDDATDTEPEATS